MTLSEKKILGIIWVFIGIGFFIVGYNKIQPTKAEKAVIYMEKLSGQKAPNSLKTQKTKGCIFIIGGVD